MPTASEKTEVTSTLSSDAYELISCFYHGVDELVYEIAEEMARQRNPQAAASGGPIQIEVEDVTKAGRQVIQALKGLIGARKLPSELEEAFGNMQQCFDNHA